MPATALFLWQSDSLPFMTEILAKLWGFRVVTDNVFIWRKPSIGMGYWSRKEGESVALLVKGTPGRKSKGVRQIIDAPRREHSRKPDEIYERIEALVAGPYLEMFARQSRQGWDSWGDETTKFDDSYDGLKDGHDSYLEACRAKRAELLKAGLAKPINEAERMIAEGIG